MKLQAVLKVGLGALVALAVGCADFGDESEVGEIDQALGGANPVILVHGCYPGPPLAPPPYENASSAQFFGPMAGAMAGAGLDARIWIASGPVCESTLDMADDLEAYVDGVLAETGAEKVDLVAHSMAGLTARAYIKQNGGRFVVDDTVIINGSNHGAGAAVFGDQWAAQFGGGAYVGAQEMYPPYACGSASVNAVQNLLNGCLTDPERVHDETPGPIDYLNLYITNDEINQPTHVACLNQNSLGDCSDPVNVSFDHVQPIPEIGLPAHVAALFDPVIIGATIAHVQ